MGSNCRPLAQRTAHRLSPRARQIASTLPQDGTFGTPWGTGRWGDASTPKRPNTLFAEFIGQVHLLTFTGANYESLRCSDGEVIKGVLASAADGK